MEKGLTPSKKKQIIVDIQNYKEDLKSQHIKDYKTVFRLGTCIFNKSKILQILGALFYLTPTMLVVDQVLAPTTVIRHVKSTLRGNDLRLAKKILMLLPAISELLHRSLHSA